MAGKSWVRVDVSCGPESADELAAGIASELGVGVEVMDGGARFYLEGDDLSREEEARVSKVLGCLWTDLSLDGSPSYATCPLPDDNWADNWKAYFKPLRIGRGFVVCPTWETVTAAAEDHVLWMDPGRAFGTGQHETTRLCLEWLEERAEEMRDMKAAARALDLGTGSGILAIGAARLGFGTVLGVDNDREALEVAAGNVLVNKVEHIVRLEAGSVGSAAGRFDVIVANILALPLVHMASELAALLSEKGRMALSGILREQAGEVQLAYESAGLELMNLKTAGDWCLLELRRCSATLPGDANVGKR